MKITLSGNCVELSNSCADKFTDTLVTLDNAQLNGTSFKMLIWLPNCTLMCYMYLHM